MVMMVVVLVVMMPVASIVSPCGDRGKRDSRGQNHRRENFLHHFCSPIRLISPTQEAKNRE
jgi:hypothetical protein